MYDSLKGCKETKDNVENDSEVDKITNKRIENNFMVTSTAINNCVDGNPCIKLTELYTDSPVSLPSDTRESSSIETIRKFCAEALGTAVLTIVVVGSGIMAESLTSDVGVQLLLNAISTCGGLVGLILMFGAVSGAHFNPIVSFVDFLHSDMSLRDLVCYSSSQIIGGIAGAIIANWEFEIPIALSEKARTKSNLWLGEFIGTVTLLLVIHGCIRTGQKSAVPFAVGGWICAGYFFTSSTIFANPAITIARMFSNTFAGINSNSVGAFIGFQYFGGVVAFALIKFFYPKNLSLKKDDNLYLRVCIKCNENC